MIKWITIQKMAEISGYTLAALRQKMVTGVFIEGVHYRHAPDGRVHFNVEAYELWVMGIKPELIAEVVRASLSALCGRASTAARQ